ncbi:MAG: hydrogenase expression/formation protein HypE [candidate division KSB1 bacterium]|nr:hydrogenase expression/formation protein HypE [candidate division KSB1 bacterium]MDZ7304388.1 hydrogenase expression/formation protein HypE [candidate division KSB1 bacterium]MDZ7313537.1 hydrogenase expression/formation protein HypE [candidate division KSB1 bacterium]
MDNKPLLDSIAFSCPIPIEQYPNVLLAHGGGGKLMHQLIEKMFVPAFTNTLLASRHDGAVLNFNAVKLAFTTDSYVVRPLFFPGGDIGTLAINGTVNDLAMCGARPLYLSAGFILEEGLPMETLWRVVQSMQKAAAVAGVQLVTGDTKVVDKGKGDGIFINTAGVGLVEHHLAISPSSVKPGDVVLLNGDLGRHGMAIMAVREGLAFETTIESDCAPLADLVMQLLDAGIEIHCLRDLTRGGLASALNEIAEASRWQIHIEETAIPVREDVQGACEILGFDPLYVANEGRFVAFVAPSDAERALAMMRAHPLGEQAGIIGRVTKESSSLVTMKSVIGATRIIDMLSGEQLPRIC